VYPDWFLAAGFFCFGLIFGSFLNVCIYRLPRGLSVVSPRSACPECHAPIAALDNIPVISWMVLRGRCRHCRARITARYAVVELVCALLFLLSYLTTRAPHAEGAFWIAAAKSCTFCFLLLGLTFTDAETHLLPDAMTLPGLAIALVFSLITLVPGPAFRLFPLHFQSPPTILHLDLQLGWRSLVNALLGAAIGSGALYAICWVYLKLRKVEGMGLGDVKLMAMAGAFLGPLLTLFVLCTASLLGGTYGIFLLLAVFRKRRVRYRARLGERASARAWRAANLAMQGMEIPFGVFLCVMSLVAWFYGVAVIRGYLRLLLIPG
jgi:leader peptidase (prepilin peptidase) / N-methyltransferase